MSDIAAFLAALASLSGLAAWSAAAHTRALGEPRQARGLAWAQIALVLFLQSGGAVAAAGLVGGLAIVACAWMVLGWFFGLVLNAWPVQTLAWSRVIGWTALGASLVLVLAG